MNHITGEPRDQIVLYAETIDGLIEEKNPVRIIDAYVSRLNIRRLGFKIKEAKKGRPSYTADVLLKIYIYGYLNKVRTTRKLENECKRNTELIWLTCRLAPDFKTIADFRRDNIKGIKNIFKEFLKVCRKLELLTFKLTATDGTKISGQNSLGNIYRRESIEGVEKKINEKIDKYLLELDKNDKSEENEFEFLSSNIEKKLDSLKTRKEKVEAIKKMFEADPELEIVYGNDPDGRIGKDKGKTDVLYNAQIAVDEKNKLIVAVDVTNESNDVHQAGNMVNKVEEIKKELEAEPGLKTIHVLDAGYYCESEILPLTDGGHEIYIPSPRDEKEKKSRYKEQQKESIPAKGYLAEDFKIDKEKNQLICPQGLRLNNQSVYQDKNTGITVAEFKCRNKNCEKKHLCTKSKEGRTVKLSVRKEDMDKFDEKVRSELGQKIVAIRKELAEHPFGTIKGNFGYNNFLLKGIDKVKSEFNFTAFIYNFKRVLNIAGFDKLLAAI